jgi:hypothetical protein
MTQRRSVSRRLFLGGAGAVVALPFLESARPRRARAASGAPQRFLGYFVPNGIRMEHFTPSAQGADYDLPRILEPLASLQKYVSVITGLANRPAYPDGLGDHASGTASFLTCTHAFKTDGENIANGVSLDQALAHELGGHTALRSLELGIDGGSSAGGCDSGYSCAYARNICWTGPSTPLPKLTDPRAVFDRLFAGFDPGATAAEAARRAARGKSVLDYVLGEANSLAQKLGKTDRIKLDEYAHGVRELELRIHGASDALVCDVGDAPGGELEYPEHVQIMSDLMVLAFQCDLTRFSTFMLGNAVSNRSYSFIGVPGEHHEISHHQDNPDNLEKLSKIATWEVTQLAYLLDKMSKVDEGDGSLLDHSCVFFSSDIEDGNTHAHTNMPILLAGSAGGKLKAGRHMVYDDERSVGSLFVSILQAFGLNQASFGDADSALPGLT